MSILKLCLSALLLAASLAVRADSLDDSIQAQMHQAHVPGLSLAVLQHGKLVKTKGYGLANLDRREPVSEHTVFEIGSLTKQLTAALVFMLAQEGKIGLDKSLTQYFEDLPAAWNGITIRHLLTHTSGLRNYTGLPGFEARRKLTRAAFIKQLSPYPLDFAPGEAFAYCNSGYNLLGYLLEKQSGLSYWQLLRTRILSPLNMQQTGDRDPARLIPRRASGYLWKTNQYLARDPDLTDVFAAGAIASTALDMAAWCVAIERHQLLTKEQWDSLWQPTRLNQGQVSQYGFGWRLDTYKGHKIIGHGGATAGFSSSLQRYPEDQLTVIVLCNLGGQGLATRIARNIADQHFLP